MSSAILGILASLVVFVGLSMRTRQPSALSWPAFIVFLFVALFLGVTAVIIQDGKEMPRATHCTKE